MTAKAYVFKNKKLFINNKSLSCCVLCCFCFTGLLVFFSLYAIKFGPGNLVETIDAIQAK